MTSGVKISPWGMWSDTRGAIPGINRNRPMYEVLSEGGKPLLRLSSRAHGEELGAVFAATGTHLVDGPTSTRAIEDATAIATSASADTLRHSGQDLVDYHAFSRAAQQIAPTPGSGLSGISGRVRPGLREDALKAAQNEWGHMTAKEAKRQERMRSPKFWLKAGGGGAALLVGGIFAKDMVMPPAAPQPETQAAS
jgi:hypothetical protein